MFTFVDLFAGIGGFHAALAGLGGECLLAVEKDPEAARVYAANWGMSALGDVTEPGWMDSVDRHVNVVAGGFPCQPFSKGGAQLGMSEARGTLFFEICKSLERWQPEIVLLENVRNLAGPRHTHEWAVIVASLRDLGYSVAEEPLIVSPHWLEDAEGGAPQNRERVYIVGTLVGKEEAWRRAGDPGTVELVRKTSGWQLAADLPLQSMAELTDLELEELSWSREERSWVAAWNNLVENLRARELEIPSFPIWVDVWGDGTVELDELPSWKAQLVNKNWSWYFDHSELLDIWAANWKVLSFPASRRKLEWQAQDAASFRGCLVQLRPSGLRVKKATHAGALVAIDQRPFIVDQGRRLSVRECARLQRFPEDFDFSSVSSRAAAKQLGNAVHVGSARKVFREHVLAPQTLRDLGVDHVLGRAALGF